MHLVAFTDPGTQKEFSINEECIVTVMPAPHEMWGSGARTIIQSNLVQAHPVSGKIASTSWVVTERYSQVMQRLGHEVAYAVIEAEDRDEREVRTSKIALPDSAVISNFARKG